MRILALSDQVQGFIYSPLVRQRFGGVDLLLGCGDLPYYYLEYVLNALDAPLFFVRGNHDQRLEYSVESRRTAPGGGVDLHAGTARFNGLLLAGLEGSLRYRPGPYQYTQREMWGQALRLVPALLVNHWKWGRYLDILVTHAPAAGVHDAPDLPHQGLRAFRWLVDVFQPALHLHGHVHVYRPDARFETRLGRTRVVNVYPYREIDFQLAP